VEDAGWGWRAVVVLCAMHVVLLNAILRFLASVPVCAIRAFVKALQVKFIFFCPSNPHRRIRVPPGSQLRRSFSKVACACYTRHDDFESISDYAHLQYMQVLPMSD